MIRKFDDFCSEEERILITRLTALQMAVYRHLCLNVQNYKKINYSPGHIMNLLLKPKNYVPCEKACNNLLKAYLRYARPSWMDETLVEKINVLTLDISNSSLKNEEVFGGGLKNNKASELSQFYMLTFLTLKETVSISNASERLGIPASTIKNACQDGRLKNIEKEGKYWRVNIDECASLWNIDIKRRQSLMPYMY